jgi:hypothetical protein
MNKSSDCKMNGLMSDGGSMTFGTRPCHISIYYYVPLICLPANDVSQTLTWHCPKLLSRMSKPNTADAYKIETEFDDEV